METKKWKHHIPKVLIHGYAQDRSVWNQWIQWLDGDNFLEVYPIVFEHEDECGSAQQHAGELTGIRQNSRRYTQ